MVLYRSRNQEFSIRFSWLFVLINVPHSIIVLSQHSTVQFLRGRSKQHLPSHNDKICLVV